jgi:RhtB (resistance to homoserine/threonine) family protein
MLLMSGISHFETFLIAGILLNLTPGNDTIFILSRSMAQGRIAGIMSVLGIATGSIIHTTLAAFGLTVIIANSLFLFNAIKFAGAAYLIFIGIQMLMNKTSLNFDSDIKHNNINYKKIYRDALLTNLLNPKVVMFFLAFLPQFIDSTYRTSVFPFLLLGFTFTFTGTVWCLMLAIFSSEIFARLRTHKKFSIWLNRVCGFVMIGLGIKVVLTKRA